jgi:hypothetical protein
MSAVAAEMATMLFVFKFLMNEAGNRVVDAEVSVSFSRYWPPLSMAK